MGTREECVDPIEVGLHWKYVNVIFEGVGMDFNATMSQPWHELPYLRPPSHDTIARLLPQLVNLEDYMPGAFVAHFGQSPDCWCRSCSDDGYYQKMTRSDPHIVLVQPHSLEFPFSGSPLHSIQSQDPDCLCRDFVQGTTSAMCVCNRVPAHQ